MTIKLGRLTIELVDDTKPVYKQPRKWNGRWTKKEAEVIFYGDLIKEINGRA